MEARRGTAVARSCRLSQDPTVAAMQAGIVGYCSSVWLDDATRYDEFAAQGCFPGCLVGRSPRKRDTLPTSAGRTGEALGRTMLTKLVHRKRSWQLATSTGSSASRWHTVKFIPDGFFRSSSALCRSDNTPRVLLAFAGHAVLSLQACKYSGFAREAGN